MIYTICIVGGGCSGALVAAHLLRSSDTPTRILLVERQRDIGRGIAYGTTHAEHLLNVPAGRMSAWPDDAEHLLRWLCLNHPDAQADDAPARWTHAFIPRTLYGTYLGDVVRQAVQWSRPGVTLERITGEVVATSVQGDQSSLTLDDGRTLVADRVVLALGHLAPCQPAVADMSFYGSPRYVANPWCDRALADLDPDAAIVLIGTGLTTVDLALALHHQGHRGAIHAISRHGLLPLAHPIHPSAAHTCALSFDPVATYRTPSTLLHQIRAEVALAARRGDDWRLVLDALRPMTQTLWQQATERERRSFVRHLRPYWEIHRHRTAPDVAATVAAMRESQLHIHRGHILGYDQHEHGVTVRIRLRGGDRLREIEAARVVNCTGPQANYSHSDVPLVADLFGAGYAHSDALGWGFDVDDHGALRDIHGHTSRVLYTLGPTRRGKLYETTSLREIREQAATLARHLAADQASRMVMTVPSVHGQAAEPSLVA